ncbi:MAG TPA: nicotinate phosphoribosyltransferase, partial [Candidatus Acidoferrales bacterium]|nr:nicotinate phosphoribosyltransferase [Candidatus Acidoferrales bacterium]
RNIPPQRNYLVAAGLEQALEYLEHVQFSAENVAFLRQHPILKQIHPEFFDYLSHFRFTGDIWAVPEGTIVFPGEPLMRVVAPIIEAQLMETYLLATLSYETMIASKAARLVTAAQGCSIVDFGARRAHGAAASLLSARAAVIGGCTGTSNVLAGQMYHLATYGTQAHSWVMAHEEEAEAFRHFLNTFPDGSVLLVDTYNVHNAIKKIIAIGQKPSGIRLDSGDLVKDSRWARRELDRVGWKDVQIFASGDLDEYKIAKLLADGAEINAFGVGTALSTPGDAPHMNLIYKLVEVERDGKVLEAAKFSHSKVTYPGSKQIFRYSNASGEFRDDKIALEKESANGGTPLLIQYMRGGQRVAAKEPVEKLRERAMDNLAHLPKRYRQIARKANYPVRYSKQLETMLEKVRRRVSRAALK